MDYGSITGRISSIQSFGTLDGPGVRFVAFLQGCPLRCGCCHNPETWETDGGSEITAGELFEKIMRCRDYFGDNGGVTLSGGEAIMQPEFSAAVFSLCHKAGIHTCLDTSGCILNDSVKKLLSVTDLVLLDIKYTLDEQYRKYVGCSLEKPMEFLKYLQLCEIPVTLRQVIIKGLNDDNDNLRRLAEISAYNKCVKKTELLAFRTLCATKYGKLGIPFRFGEIEETEGSTLAAMQKRLEDYIPEITAIRDSDGSLRNNGL